MKEFDKILRSDSGYIRCSNSYNLVHLEGLPFQNSKLSERNFHQGIKLHIINFNLTDMNIRTVIILLSIHLLSINTPKSSYDEPL